MPVQLIVSDLDGTLFKMDHSGEISDENLRAIQAAQEKGASFFVCTGRPITDIYHRIYRYPELQNVGIAGMNGASCIANSEGKPIYNQRLPEEVWRSCVEIIKKFPVKSVLSGSLFRNGKLWLDYPSEDELLNSSLGYDEPGYTHPDDGADWDDGINKIQCIGQPYDPILPVLRDALLEKHPDLEIRSSWHSNIEIGPANCQKGSAIRMLGKRFGVPLENIMALGDNENDIPMLETAGIGVCMSNGTNGAKTAACYIADNSDSCGVARAIEHFLKI